MKSRRDIIGLQGVVLLTLGLGIVLSCISFISQATLSNRIDILEENVNSQLKHQLEKEGAGLRHSDIVGN